MHDDQLPDWPTIHAAARRLEQGALVAFPTETVYGLGADAENRIAVERMFAAKGRPSHHPAIVHLAPEADLRYWAESVPAEARKLIDVFWPGPLTLILKRAARIPDAVSGGQDSIGLRCPSHPVAQALLREFRQGKGGLAAPSANRFGRISPTTAQHVREEFRDVPDNPVDCVLDGGQSEVGIESTILDLSRLSTQGPVLLRPGQVSAHQIADIIAVWPGMPDTDAPRASGTLESHYAPRTPVALVSTDHLSATIQQLGKAGRRIALMHFSALPIANGDKQFYVEHASLPAMPGGYAHDLYATLRRMDTVGAELILIESPPEDGEWQGINDRLHRAAFDSSGVLSRLLTY
jgi:L-threonylcarbamoyladenylate synthase